ncbi:MAG: NAD-dependent epimerase/dehydratase family protein [Elusimicrobiaceae bacterium]|jgi:UDP-glucose 4-epimerase
MKYRCVLVGGSGFLGSHISAALLAAGHGVTVFDRVAPSVKSRRPPVFIKGDYANSADLKKALRGQDIVFHLAWTTVPATPFEEIGQDAAANIANSVNLFRVSVEQGIQKIIFVSSGGTVYGDSALLPVSETMPTEPLSSYGIAKLAVEKYLYLFHRHCKADYLVLRIANPYGPGQNPEGRQGLVPKLLAHSLSGAPICVFGGGKAVRDYIYVDDMVDAITAVVERGVKNTVLNIGSGHGLSIMEVIKAVSALTGKIPVLVQKPARDSDVKANVLDIRRIKRLTGWKPVTSFDAGLCLTLDWINSIPAENNHGKSSR